MLESIRQRDKDYQALVERLDHTQNELATLKQQIQTELHQIKVIAANR